VVLCSSSKSYSVRHAESTNALLLLPSVETGVIVASLHGILEVKPCRPRFARLHQILAKFPYRGKVGDASTPVSCLHTQSALQSVVQCSDGELQADLRAVGAFELRGFVRTNDVQFEHTMLELLLCLVLEYGWSYAAVPVKEATAILTGSDCDAEVVHSLLLRYGDGGVETVKLNALLVSLAKARILLQSKPLWIVADFFAALTNALPLNDYFPLPKVADLYGCCIVEEKGTLSSIRYFVLDSVFEDSIEDTFGQLFATRPTWPIEQLIPFIQSLAGPAIEQVLLRYCFVNRMDPKNVTVSKR
jgi:hypothetical protein